MFHYIFYNCSHNTGEQSQWGKSTLLGLDIHVPMLLKVPGITDDGQTWETDEFVELVDVFPTLVDAAGLDAISQCPDNSADVDTCHEGLSAWRSVFFKFVGFFILGHCYLILCLPDLFSKQLEREVAIKKSSKIHNIYMLF